MTDFLNIPKEEIQRAFDGKQVSKIQAIQNMMSILFDANFSKKEIARIFESKNPRFIFGQPDEEFIL